MQRLKAHHHILLSSAETRRAFNSGFDSVNLHRSTWARSSPTAAGADSHVEASPNVGSFTSHTSTLVPVFLIRTDTVLLVPWM
jgi:hypothetical protein